MSRKILFQKCKKCSIAFFLLLPMLTACSPRQFEGSNIDLPPERPGRFMPEAAAAEARAAQRDIERIDQQQRKAAALAKKQKKPSPPAERYETLPPDSAGAAGPIRLDNGHTVIPETQAIYGKPASPPH
ncbi:MAG: hypothetical protein J6P29_03170 [Acetobacter sp.]|nr:hypothetical protein [Acetobacter sp.]